MSAHPAEPYQEETKRDATRSVAPGAPWVWLVPILVLAALLLGYRSCGVEPRLGIDGREVSALPSAAGGLPVGTPDLGAFVERRLPGSVTLSVPERGVESKLLAFITDATRPADRNTWFSFDRLEFDTGAATLRASSGEQLQNIAAILEAYPAVEVKIGGYTDDVGDEASNLELSQARATNTMNALVQLGVAPARLAAEGYGEEYPVASNDTEEGRQRNRRIDIRVTKK